MKTITTKATPPFAGSAMGIAITASSQFTLEIAAFTATGEEIRFTLDTEFARRLAVGLIEEASALDRELDAQIRFDRNRIEQRERNSQAGSDDDDDMPF